MDTTTIVIIAVIILLVVIGVAKNLTDDPDMTGQKQFEKDFKRQQEEAKVNDERKRSERTFERAMRALKEKFGECQVTVNLGPGSETDFKRQILVFPHSQAIFIKGALFRFSEIIDYTFIDEVSGRIISAGEEASERNNSDAGARAAIGWLAAGAAGAFIGAATAGRRTDSCDYDSEVSMTHDYYLYLKTSFLSIPSIPISLGENTQEAMTVEGVIRNVIILGRENKDKEWPELFEENPIHSFYPDRKIE